MEEIPVELMVISGGEPLLALDTVGYAVRWARNRKTITALVTNGLLLDRKTACLLTEWGLGQIQISLDGSSDDAHEALRGPGTFRKAIAAIQTCLNANLSLAVMTVPTRATLGELPRIHHLLSELGVRHWGIERPVPVPGSPKDSFRFEKKELLRFHDLLDTCSLNSKMRIHCNDPIYLVRNIKRRGLTAEKFRSILPSQCRGCTAGVEACVVGVDGSVRPCTFLSKPVANLRERSLRDIWNDQKLFAHLREAKPTTGSCANCDYLNVCGRCPAQIPSWGQDPLASDSTCYINDDDWGQSA